MKAIINATYYDYHTFRKDAYILFDKTIREVGDMKDFPGADEVMDAGDAMVLPGLINGHAHMYGAFFRGIPLSMNPRSFTELLRQFFWKIDAELDCEATYHGARVYGVEHIKQGVTSIFDHHAGGLEIIGSLDAVKKGIVEDAGMRGLFCFETSDRFPIDQCIEENLRFAKKEKGEMCRGLFGMHASLSVSDKTLAQVGEAIGDIPLHVHMGESLEDELKSINDFGHRIAQRFDSFGLLNEDSILAHCVNIDESEAEVIAARKCVVALNPTSNMNTGVGVADTQMLKRHGIRTMIGNDNLGIDLTIDYRNTIYANHLRYGSPMSFGYDDLLRNIHQVYDYASKSFGVKIGKIEKGYAADLIVVPHRFPVEVTQENAFGYVVDGLYNVFKPRDVFIAGENKMKNYITIFDEEKIYSQARAVSKALWDRVGG